MVSVEEIQTADLQRFESLGDNCEFGFVQRSMGVDVGSLLKWSITRPLPLLNLLRSDFRNLYLFDNLVPSSNDMVLDRATDIFFHTALRSESGQFIDDTEQRKTIWQTEIEKIDYLVEKLRKRLSEEVIFVYKQNTPIGLDLGLAIAREIRARGGGKLLLLTNSGSLLPGDVIHLKENAYLARVDYFAPYETADKASYEIWTKILIRASIVCMG